MALTIEEQMAVLERQNRRLKLVGGSAIGLVLLAAVFGIAAPKKPKPRTLKRQVIEAEKFVLRAKDGSMRAELKSVDNGGAGLALYDANGQVRAVLSARKSRSILALMDENEKERVILCVGKEQSPTIILRQADGARKLSMLVPFPVNQFRVSAIHHATLL